MRANTLSWDQAETVTRAPSHLGKTPLEHYRFKGRRSQHEIFFKLERFNTYGSIKDRVAWVLVDEARRSGALAQGGAVIDASSGNYGCALANIGRELGIAVSVVASPNITAYNRDAISEVGGTLHIAITKAGESAHDARFRIARELAEEQGAVFLDQYHNPANSKAHRDWTAPESLNGINADMVFVCSSSGGTARGVSEYLHVAQPDARLKIVDSVGSSAVLIPDAEDEKPSIPGFGASKPSWFLPLATAHDVIRVSDDSARTAFLSLRDDGRLPIGLSSSAQVLAALAALDDEPAGRTAVCICPDGSEKYQTEMAGFAPDVDADPGRGQVRDRMNDFLDRLVRP
jgi:N-(2-amino-2-carboxyethyl)-L-glutamate synthase